ncbi:hypothetical protein VKT23_008234 [Stygiomarasmius scandens]|uniref:Carboxylic ester hydrolase n=1 Tax=Marasmiellus scandens TaxID=2682957 RepID=A0ABR1JI92_9AGAR
MLQFLSLIGTTLLATLVQKFLLWTGGNNIVDLGYVKYQGNLSFPDTVAYLGIPYAEPPVGDRRFRAPLSLNTSRVSDEAGGKEKIVDASHYPEFCIQGALGGADKGGAGSEDCLKVNVYAPAGAKPNDKLPVLVYFHGGGYINGNPQSWPYDHWIHQSPNVIVVAVQYRLFSFGFLAVPEFRDPSLGDFNVGFQDQTQALRWVQEHITAFGGDPTKVTIDGHSAGGASVELHLVATDQEGLFSGAIVQSVYRASVPPPEQQQLLFERYADKAGCGSGSVTDKLACLRKASVSALAQAQDSAWDFDRVYNIFRPVADGRIITEPPTVSLSKGRFAKVPIMAGATTDETYYGFATSGTVETSLRAIFPSLNDKDVKELVQAYPASDFSSLVKQLQTGIAESLFICGVQALGNAFADATGAWTYRFDQMHPTGDPSLGVMHTAENWYMFLGTDGTGSNGTTIRITTGMDSTETAFGEELIAYWISFVRSGNPNTFKLDRSPTWAQYTNGEGKRERIVLRKGPADRTDVTGSFMEEMDQKQARRCSLVLSKAERQQN